MAIWSIFISFKNIQPCAQAASHVLEKFNEAARLLRLGVLQPESMFLLRFEDKIFWIQVMEKGNGYFSYSLKGGTQNQAL